MSFQSFVLSHLAIAPVCITEKLPINTPELFAYCKVTMTQILNAVESLPSCKGRLPCVSFSHDESDEDAVCSSSVARDYFLGDI